MKLLKDKIGYGFGDMSSSMFWKIFSYYLPFFYSNVFGLGLGDAATLVLITKLWDAVSDPMMGLLADRTVTKWGRFRPYLLWVAVPFAIIGVLTFTTPDFGDTGKLIWAYITYILMMTVYTAINVPYGALLGVITDDPKERTVFSSFRMFFAYTGSFIAIAIFDPLREFFRGDISGLDTATALSMEQSSWQHTMMIIGGVCTILFILCFVMTKERVLPKGNIREKGSLVKDLKALVTNIPWWILLGAALCACLFNTVRGGAAAYFFKDYVGPNGSLGILFGSSVALTCGIYLAVGEVANMLGVVLAVPLSNKVGKKMAYITAMIGSAILSILFYYVPTGENAAWLLLGLQILISICAGITFPLIWSMFADVSDHSEKVHGRNTTGLIFSSSSMSQKFGAAFGSSMILLFLSSVGYQTEANAVQNADALNGLNLLMSWIPAVTCLLGAIAVFFYPIKDNK